MNDLKDFLIINGFKCPAPDQGYEIVTTQAVDAGRNAQAAMVGQKVGRRQWKINGLQWTNLSAEEWAMLRQAIEPFYVLVTFTGDDNQRHTVHMYPSDTTGRPLQTNSIFFGNFETCKFNLIDAGWDE